MTDQSPKYKLYPSSSGFAQDDSVYAEYNSACLRYLKLAQGAKKPDIDPLYSVLGKQHEDWYSERLGTRLWQREEPVKVSLGDGVEYSGRIDFRTLDGVIHETKASLSKNFLYNVIRKKNIKVSHLGQLVSYMLTLKNPEGVLAAGFYTATKINGHAVFTLSEYTEFTVKITDQGQLLVNGDVSNYTAHDQLKFQMLAKKALISEEMPPRPVNHRHKWASPCSFCSLKNLCDAYDKKIISSVELGLMAKEVIETTPSAPLIIKEPKNGPKRTNGNRTNTTRGLQRSRKRN